MPGNGLIYGDAPPFILLVFILGSMFAMLSVLKEAEQLLAGIKFKKYARRISFFCSLFPLFFGFTITYRIIINGYRKDYDFMRLDLFILGGIFISFTLVLINALVSSRIKRKYNQEFSSPNRL